MLSAKIAYAAVSAAGILLSVVINTTFYLNYYRIVTKKVPGIQNLKELQLLDCKTFLKIRLKPGITFPTL